MGASEPSWNGRGTKLCGCFTGDLGSRLTLGVAFHPAKKAGILAASGILIRRPLQIDLLQRLAIPAWRKIMGALEGFSANPYGTPLRLHIAMNLAAPTSSGHAATRIRICRPAVQAS